jgi:hypothetical protein
MAPGFPPKVLKNSSEDVDRIKFENRRPSEGSSDRSFSTKLISAVTAPSCLLNSLRTLSKGNPPGKAKKSLKL